MNSLTSRKIAMVFIMVFQAILIFIYAFFVKYGSSASPPEDRGNSTEAPPTESEDMYPLFQDVHVMIFVGFGFLMTFLKKYAFSALGFTFLVSSLVIQWAILVGGFFEFHSVHDRIHLEVASMMEADVAAAVILISLGAVLGRISPIQLLLMAILETVLYCTNEYVNVEVLKAVDAGGSMYVHAFGAYFGLAVSFVMTKGVSQEQQESGLESSSYQSDISSMLGTLFLWMFWPSFTAGMLTGDQKVRALLNTYLALTSSCLMTFAMSSMLNKEKKFEMAHVQNATLAGGVIIGTCVNFMIHPYYALIIGAFGGILSTIGFKFIQDFLRKKLSVVDTCGVNNLHGMPGVAASIIGALFTVTANRDTYNDELFEVFPAMGPGDNRSWEVQMGYQFAALGTTLGISIGGGLLTGAFITFSLPKMTSEEYYDDITWYETAE